MNTIPIIAVIVAAAVTAAVIAIYSGSKPLNAGQAEKAIQKSLDSAVRKNKTITGGLLLISSQAYGINQTFTAGNIEPDTPFHVASIGKAFTAALIGSLIDEGKMDLNTRVSTILAPEVLKGLFIVDETDYSSEVTIGRLLNHTSGAADYFEDPAEGSAQLQELIISEPDRFWTPSDLLTFSRDFQTPAGVPGAQYHYSDTGYILLGLIIEEVTGQAFHKVLHERIFKPLQMDDSYLMFYSGPTNGRRPIADIWIGGIEVSSFESVSIDWAGGGIISTASDLAVFIRALNRGEVISKETLESLYNFDQSFMKGIHYGRGFMEYHFKEFFPTLGSMPHLRGHMGVLGTQMFYDAPTDTVYISSFGSIDYSAGSVRTMIKVLNFAMRIDK